MTVTIYTGDALDVLKTLDANSVQCCVTSPPYWGLRDYGIAGQLGMEKTPGEYVEHLVAIFREVWRVLRGDGALWLNLGDSYANPGNKRNGEGESFRDMSGGMSGRFMGTYNNHKTTGQRRVTGECPGLKPKDLCGIPWRVAFALQQDGWWLRSDIIWAKPNPMPESVTDRPTKAHEYLFLLTKSARYYYDAEAVKEASNGPGRIPGGNHKVDATRNDANRDMTIPVASNRNLRTVWTIATAPFPGAHFATFPPALVEPCVKAGTSEKGRCPVCGAPWRRVVEHTNKPDASAKGSRFDKGKTAVNGMGRVQEGERFVKVSTGWQSGCTCGGEPVPCIVLDPFGGAGTVGLVADRLQRDAVLIELNPEYCRMAADRIKADGGFMADVRIIDPAI